MPIQTTRQIKYESGYKYQLKETAFFRTSLTTKSGEAVKLAFITMSPDGLILVKAGYAWDGASGPTVDSDSSMRPSLLHDVICQLMRLGYVDRGYISYANNLFQQMCVEDGMFQARALIWRAGVAIGTESATATRNVKPIYVSPKKLRN